MAQRNRLTYSVGLVSYPEIPSLALAKRQEEAAGPVLNIHFCKEEEFCLPSTPRGATAQEIRVECFFPADSATELFFQPDAKRYRRPVSCRNGVIIETYDCQNQKYRAKLEIF